MGVVPSAWLLVVSPTEQAFLRALPAGEWADVAVVNEHGLMRGRAIQADALWQREGGVPARLKCFVETTPGAGRTTADLLNRPRLERMRARLSTAAKRAPGSLVRLLHVDFLPSFPGLLIAMERVRPLRNVLESARLSPRQGAQLIRTLSHKGAGWIHFDICPANTGLTTDGRYVFIDPDSYYSLDTDRYQITYPALKERLPRAFKDRLAIALASNLKLPRALAEEKHDGEVLLLAAECCLGDDVQWPLTAEGVGEWIKNSACSKELAAVLSPPLLRLANGNSVDLETVAIDLDSCEQSPDAVQLVPTTINTPSVPDLGNAVASSWEELAAARHALRAERLKGSELAEYREQVLAKARETQDRRFWREAVAIALGYERDAEIAIRVVEEALLAFPDDPDFLRDQRLVLICQGKI